jgi:hypothetical protein
VPDAELGAVVRADSDLAAVVTAWATLPQALKAGIVAMVRTATEGEGVR